MGYLYNYINEVAAWVYHTGLTRCGEYVANKFSVLFEQNTKYLKKIKLYNKTRVR